MESSQSGKRKIRIAMLLAAWIVSTVPADSYFYGAPPTEEFKHWQEVQNQGAEAFFNSEYGKAERLLRQAVEEGRNIGPDDPRIAKSMGDLGRLLAVRGRFKEAQQYLEEEFYIRDRAAGDDIGEIVLLMEDLIRFYITCGTAEKAKPLTEDLIDFVQGKFREQCDQKSKTVKLENGMLTGWTGTAAPVMRDPLLEWAITCDKLGDLYKERRDYDMADRLYKTALDVKGTVLGKKHLSLATSYDSLGTICLLKKEMNDAESYFKEALDICEGVLEKNDPAIYGRVYRLANCYIAEKKYSEAEELFQNAIRRWAWKPDIEHRALYSLGCMYSDQKRFGSAAPLLGKALKLSQRVNGAYSVSNVPYLKKYAYVLYYCGRRGESENMNAVANNISPPVKELKATVKIGRLE